MGIRLLATSTEEDLVVKSELFPMHGKYTTEIGLYFSGQDVLVARSIKLFQSAAHFNLALAAGVCFGRVEHVDAVLPRALQTLLHDVAFQSTAIGKPSSQREYGNL